MKDDDLERFSDDEGHPVAKVGLRSLREERAPESSMKATLDVLRRSGAVPAPQPSGARTFLVWAVAGAIVAAGVAWLLFFR